MIFRLRIDFSPNTKDFTKGERIDCTNGFINNVLLGKNNEYHDKYSNYSVSQMRGGSRIDEEGVVQYDNGGVLLFSTDDINIIERVINNIERYGEKYIQTMKIKEHEMYVCSVGKDWDNVFVEDILLSYKTPDGKKNATKDDDFFLDMLLERCKGYLINEGLPEEDVNTLSFEPICKERWKKRTRYLRTKADKGNKPIPYKTSTIKIKVRGKKNVREKLIANGFGQCTGCGFGFAFLNKDIDNLK